MYIVGMDANILLSIINMKLRDSYSSLDKLCEDMEIDEEELIDKLAANGYSYYEDINQFR